MSYQVLARKYRPQKFSDVIGQDHVTRTLKNAIEQGRIAHGYIFSGHRGIGKTTIARILAMALNCQSQDHPVPEPCGVCDSCREIRAGNSVDVIEIDAATNRGIDEIRELREAARYRPARDRFKIYILDEAHQITDAAFNALLKTLEEPPSHIVFMMATTQPEDIPQTIRSRCQHFSFHAVRFDDIVQQLRDIAEQEGIPADDDALAMLAEVGDGSMRDALSIHGPGDCLLWQYAERRRGAGLVGTVASAGAGDVMDAVARNSSEDVLRTIDRSWWSRAESAALRAADAALSAQCAGGQSCGQRFAGAADFYRRARARGARGGTLQRGRPVALYADHAAHPQRAGIQAGAALPSGAGTAEAGACAAAVAAGELLSAQWKRAQQSRTGPGGAAHERKVRSGNQDGD
jgi:DNA polymerase III subunit gamma/tau